MSAAEPHLTTAERIDLLKALRASAWEDFHTRRAFEWKVSFGIWTAVAASIASLLTDRLERPARVLVPCVLFVGILIVSLHVVFVSGIARANKLNRDRQFFFEAEMMKLVQLNYPEEITVQVSRVREDLGRLGNWAHFFQVWVTIVLVVTAVISIVLLRE